MRTAGGGRYSNTELFLANIDEEEVSPIGGDDESAAHDLDELGSDGDLAYAAGPEEGPSEWTEAEVPDVGPPAAGAHDQAPAFATPAISADDPNAGYDRGDDGDDGFGEDYGDGDHGTAQPANPDGDLEELPSKAETASPSARFSKPIVIGFGSAVAVVTIGLAAAMIGMQSNPSQAPTPSGESSVVAVAPPPAPAAAPINDPTQDVPILFQASSPCPQAGSASAQNVASDDPTRAWVCMRDSDGQVLTMDLGKPMKVTAISITAGWVGTDASGADQWMAHRVVTRVQWILINGADRTVVTQDTKNAHGPVVQPMPSNGPDQGVLASQIQMIVLQTSRPPADTPAPSTPGAPSSSGGLLDGVLGAPVGGTEPSAAPSQDPNFGTTDTGNSDPVDNTVAVSSIKILGHPPL